MDECDNSFISGQQRRKLKLALFLRQLRPTNRLTVQLQYATPLIRHKNIISRQNKIVNTINDTANNTG